MSCCIDFSSVVKRQRRWLTKPTRSSGLTPSFGLGSHLIRVVVLLLCLTSQNLLAQTPMEVGTGIGNVTDPSIGLSMQGMADQRQTIQGVEQNLYSRAFIIKQGNTSVVLVITDLWAGTSHVKKAVVETLESQGLPYHLDNVLISGTHNHSGMGGYTKNKLYEHATGGFQPSTFDIVVKGIVRSIVNAHDNLASGKIYINKGDIADVGRQRSMDAYQNNVDTNQYPDSTDKEMVLLKFVQIHNGQDIPIGILNWYAIHPTDRGQSTRLINGDNKGWASYLFEQHMGTDYHATTTFVAGFANSSAGDVSGNVEYGQKPDGINDIAHMKDHGQQQFDKARTLFMSTTEELTGTIDYRYTYVDMSQVTIEGTSNRTWPAALGLSFATGSSEDSTPEPDAMLNEGLPKDDLTLSEKATRETTRAAFDITFGSTNNSTEFKHGHGKKPIVLAPGLMSPSIVPQILPFQLITIGQLAIIAGPGEFNTMAGRRLKQTVKTALQGSGITHVVLAGYANEYTQYIATKEEYDMQHYEGASTLFGPYTLQAYQQEYRHLANALKSGATVNWTPYLPPATAPTAKRIIIRNDSSSNQTFRFYRQNDTVCSVALQELSVSANKQYAHSLIGLLGIEEFDSVKARSYLANIWQGCKDANRINIGQLLTVRANGTTHIGAFNYQHPAQTAGPYTAPTDFWNALRSHHGSYLSVRPDGVVYTAADAKDLEALQILYNTDKTVSLRSYHNTYLGINPDGEVYTTGQVGEWERFQKIHHADQTVSLRSHHGTYLKVKPNGDVESALLAQDWEKFTITTPTFPEQTISLSSHHDTYLGMSHDGTVYFKSPVGEWETLTMITHPDLTVSLRSYHNTYLGINPDGEVYTTGQVGEWEKFQKIYHADQTVSLRSRHGTYLGVRPNGNVFTKDRVDEWEKFNISIPF